MDWWIREWSTDYRFCQLTRDMKTNEDRRAHVHDNGSLFSFIIVHLVLDAAIRPLLTLTWLAEIKNLKSKIEYLAYKKVRGDFGLSNELLNVKIGQFFTEEIDFENGTRRGRLWHPRLNKLYPNTPCYWQANTKLQPPAFWLSKGEQWRLDVVAALNCHPAWHFPRNECVVSSTTWNEAIMRIRAFIGEILGKILTIIWYELL